MKNYDIMQKYGVNVYNYVEKDTGIHVVKAVANYDGKSIYAFAKCAPEDSFDLKFGTDLALMRLALKIEQLRVNYMLDYAKFCKRNLEFIECEKRRTKKAMERAEIAVLDRRVMIREIEDEIAEMLEGV